jgi:hypothetical protein
MGLLNMKNKRTKFGSLMTALVLGLLLPACGGSGGGSSDDPEPKDPNPLEDTVIKITYNEGVVWAGSQIYCIWLESNTDNTILPILITGRSRNPFGQIGSSLAYWRLNKKTVMEASLLSAGIDAVTSATPNLPAANSGNEVGKQIAVPIGANVSRGRGGFTVTKSISGDLREFTVYFEIEHSFDANMYFADQPAVLYKAVIDLDNFPASGEVEFDFAGWTPYSAVTIDGVSRPAGVLQTDAKYINTVDPTASTAQYPATDMMINKAKVTIVH